AGVTTNVEFLGRIIASRAFAGAELDTGLIERNRAELLPPRHAPSAETLALAAQAELAAEAAAAREAARALGAPHSPWHEVDGWRLNGDSHHDFVFVDEGVRHPVRVLFSAEGRSVLAGGENRPLEGAGLKGTAVRAGEDWYVFRDGESRRLSLEPEL